MVPERGVAAVRTFVDRHLVNRRRTLRACSLELSASNVALSTGKRGHSVSSHQRQARNCFAVAISALVMLAAGTTVCAADLDRFPLSPPDISTPLAALQTFRTETTAATNAYQAGDLKAMRTRAERGLQSLEVEHPVTDANFVQSLESALYLLEILIRIEVPPDAFVPGRATSGDATPFWTIPSTDLRLVKVVADNGEVIGYRFSAATIRRLPEFYERVRDLPVLPGSERYDGAVERFRMRPGFAAPGFVVRFVQSLPSGWFASLSGEPLWKWAALALGALVAAGLFMAARAVTALIERGARPDAWSRLLLRPLLAVVALIVVAVLRFVAVDVIRLTGPQRELAQALLDIVAHAVVIWLIFLAAVRVADAIIRGRDMGVYSLDTQLVRLVTKLLAVLLALYAVVNLTETLGVPVAPVLAGLGVGGLAVALAVRPTLENVVAGFVLFADSPVRVGEFCSFGDKMGTVEAIGLRSVRIRALDRTLIAVPNAEFCQLQLINFTRRDAMLLRKRLQLRYETSPDQLRLVLVRLRELLVRHPMVSPDPARVRFVDYAEASLNLEIFAYVNTRDFGEFLAVQEDLNLRIKDIVEDCGCSFAFPSQTLYVEQSRGPDADLAKAAEAEVARWRSENRLPFPDFDEQERNKLSGTLDYPPQGSPERRQESVGSSVA